MIAQQHTGGAYRVIRSVDLSIDLLPLDHSRTLGTGTTFIGVYDEQENIPSPLIVERRQCSKVQLWPANIACHGLCSNNLKPGVKPASH
jgi:hypothetical protein